LAHRDEFDSCLTCLKSGDKRTLVRSAIDANDPQRTWGASSIRISGVAVLGAGAIANGQSGPPQTGSTNAPYTMPSLADIMSIMQWRHLKLAYNWPLAAFEVGQMQQSFSAAAQRYPVFKNLPLTQLIKDESDPPLPKSPKRSS
jgi:hypothetical protein